MRNFNFFSRGFAGSVFLALYGLKALSVRMESYLHIRNNLFFVSFWKHAPFGRLPAFQAG